MATSVVSNTITSPDGTPVANVPVVITLVPAGAFRIDNSFDMAPIDQAVITSNGGGNWTATLEQNANLSPAGSYYLVNEQVPAAAGGPRWWAIVVPATNVTLKAALKPAST